jgi:hypothetical protein
LTKSRECALKFGPGYRWCTSQEILNTVEVPSSLTSVAWVRPEFVAYAADGYAMDASGIFQDPYVAMTCRGWFDITNSATGLAVNFHDGASFYLQICGVRLPVTCCGPPLPTP